MRKVLENTCKCNGTGIIQIDLGWGYWTKPCHCDLGKVEQAKIDELNAQIQVILDDLEAKRNMTA